LGVQAIGAWPHPLSEARECQEALPQRPRHNRCRHYQTGEGPREGVREIFEEIGLDVTLDDLTALGVKFDLAKIGDVVNREFCDVFLLSNDSAPDAYELDPEEVEGLVEIAIPDGLDLFSGRREEVIAAGVELNVADGEWHDIEMSVTVDDFIPRLDAYYKKVFILTDLARKGYRDLAI